MAQIKITKETRDKLNLMKYTLGLKKVEEVIQELIKNYNKKKNGK